MMSDVQEKTAAFYTPRPVAEYLARWAIRRKDDVILEPAAGTGIFCEVAAERLHSLGATFKDIGKQVHAVEIDEDSFLVLRHKLSKYNVPHSNIINSNFLLLSPSKAVKRKPFSLPYVDVVLGNPPYIERQKLTDMHGGSYDLPICSNELSMLADMYAYFILHAARFIRPGGRLGFVLSDTWLSTNFGTIIKKFLSQHFRINAIIGFDRRIFNNAEVRTILLLAEKAQNAQMSQNKIHFIQLRDVNQIERSTKSFTELSGDSGTIIIEKIAQRDLSPKESWDLYLKGSQRYKQITKHPLICTLSEIANCAIGLQTLCKDFYILEKSDVDYWSLEEEFLESIAFTPRDTPLVIGRSDEIKRYVFYCDKEKEELRGTNALEYIKQGETTVNSLRGKKKQFVGYHNRPRIMKSRRSPWYNLKPEIQRRCRNPVLLPRRIFRRYSVVSNEARVVNNESFLGITPAEKRNIQPLLAFLNSTFGEYACRIEAHIYGGGIFDLRPGDAKKLPVLNFAEIECDHLEMLSKSYKSFLREKGENRQDMDESVREILGLSKENWGRLSKHLQRIKSIALRSKRVSNKG